MRPYEAFVYGNSADEPNKLAERCLDVIGSTLKSVARVTACLRAAELEHGIGIAAMTRAESLTLLIGTAPSCKICWL